MVVVTPAGVAFLTPPADVAVGLGVGVGAVRSILGQRTLQASPHQPVVGRVVVYPEPLGLKLGPGRHDVHMLGRTPLDRCHQRRIQRKLEDGPALGLTGELGVVDLV